ncbi:MAG: hypothetical protein KF761_08450 [Salinibacterium sp.]|nr:hypothetical protein [Salinibacterium sp.]
MMQLPRDSDAALAPVRAYVETTAKATAAENAASAQRRADTVIAAAQHESDGILTAATAEGAEMAASAAALASARARRNAHETVLARRNAIRLELARQVGAAASELVKDPVYPALLKRLTERAYEALGTKATVKESPDGGVVATAGSRRIDLSLPVLAARKLDTMTEEVEHLWMQ